MPIRRARCIRETLDALTGRRQRHWTVRVKGLYKMLGAGRESRSSRARVHHSAPVTRLSCNLLRQPIMLLHNALNQTVAKWNASVSLT